MDAFLPPDQLAHEPARLVRVNIVNPHPWPAPNGSCQAGKREKQCKLEETRQLPVSPGRLANRPVALEVVRLKLNAHLNANTCNSVQAVTNHPG